MDADRPQSFANHRANSPVYVLAGAALAADVVIRLVDAVKVPTFATIWGVAVAAALVFVWRKSRGAAQTVQDRVIRLEMRLRLERVLPAERRGEFDRLSLGQLVALRFASDAELPALVGEVLAQDVQNRNAIKRRIKDWQPDWLRA